MASLGFVLYGGTAVALRLANRHSVDFDFFKTDRLTKLLSEMRSVRLARP